MDGKMKFYLLAELSGWNCQAYLKDERKKVQESESLSILKDNVRKAKGHLSGKAREVVRSYENLRIDPKTIYQAFLIENSIDYLALHSFPEYYINPLAIDPDYEGEITFKDEVADFLVLKTIATSRPRSYSKSTLCPS